MIKKFIDNFYSYKNIKKTISQNRNNIIFFSEGNHHYTHLKPFINFYLKEQHVIYITLSKNDSCANIDNKNFSFFYLDSFFFLNLFFKTISNSLIFTSLPDLGKLYFKKYPNNKNTFIYIFHSLASVHIQYNHDAFKEYDIIFCAGPHHFNELTNLKEKYQLKYIKLIKYGYPLIENISKNEIKPNKNKILIASTWGDNSITNTVAIELIQNLIKEKKYKIIFRPHVMSFKKDYSKLNEIKKKFLNSKFFEFDNSNSSDKSLVYSELLITDWGSTSADFYIGLNKPVIFVNTDMKIKNKFYKEIDLNAFEIDIRNKIDKPINLNDLKKISEKVAKKIFEHENTNFREELISKYIYNFNKSDELLEIELKKLLNQKIIIN